MSQGVSRLVLRINIDFISTKCYASHSNEYSNGYSTVLDNLRCRENSADRRGERA